MGKRTAIRDSHDRYTQFDPISFAPRVVTPAYGNGGRGTIAQQAADDAASSLGSSMGF